MNAIHNGNLPSKMVCVQAHFCKLTIQRATWQLYYGLYAPRKGFSICPDGQPRAHTQPIIAHITLQYGRQNVPGLASAVPIVPSVPSWTNTSDQYQGAWEHHELQNGDSDGQARGGVFGPYKTLGMVWHMHGCQAVQAKCAGGGRCMTSACPNFYQVSGLQCLPKVWGSLFIGSVLPWANPHGPVPSKPQSIANSPLVETFKAATCPN
jgi:hypothetical protein